MFKNIYTLSSTLLNKLAWFSFITVGFMGFYYMPWALIDTSENGYSYTIIFIIGALLSIICILLSYKLPNYFKTSELELKNPFFSLANIIILGIILRCCWLLLVPPVQLSDFQDYLEVAQRLLETGRYYYTIEGYELQAWRPPGYPFFLAACMSIVGQNFWIPAFTNIIFYMLTCIFVYRILKPIGGKGVSLVAVFILTLWPSYIAMTGLAAAEPLSLMLFTAALWAFMFAKQNGWGYALFAGLLTGFGTLVKPALLMLPFLWILFNIMDKERKWKSIRNTFIAIIGMALVISPWAVRNYHVLDAVVLVSTNGGDVFYRANNPKASGGFTTNSENDLNPYLHDELLWNQTGFSWGMQWIKEHPVDFLKLILKKQGIFLGTDETGVYWTLLRGHNQTEFIYSMSLILSNIWWATIWMMALVGVIKHRQYLSKTASGGLILWMTLFFVVVHSVFESQPRYHIPMIGMLSILAALALREPIISSQRS